MVVAHRIAVVDDEEIVRREITRSLKKEDYEVESFADAESALHRLTQVGFDLVLCDLCLPGMSGMDFLRETQRSGGTTEVIIMTGYSSVDSAIEAIRDGAFHYLTKPVKLAELKVLVRRALDTMELTRETTRLKEALRDGMRPAGMIGHSVPIQEVYRLIDKVAAVDCNVLIQGASGTGKEMVARALHQKSSRSAGPFVCFNCGGFNEELISNELFGHEKDAYTGATGTKEGLLETAHTGSIFLDEIEEMPVSMQVKLLRFVEDRTLTRVGGLKPRAVDVRLIAAGNRDLKEMVEAQTFREDLFYRLNVVTIKVPLLRERTGDLPLLVAHFLDKHTRTFGKKVHAVSPEAMRTLKEYAFPGNVRELENIIERAVALTDSEEITIHDLPSEICGELRSAGIADGRWPSLEEHEIHYIREVLAATNQSKTRAAEILQIPRTTLWRKLKRYGLE